MLEKNHTQYFNNLKIDCSKCFGLCCTALYFAACEGFPQNKDAGIPCKNLNNDFTCKIHSSLQKKGLKGCTSFDCFGAGQKIAQTTYKNTEYKSLNDSDKKKMYDGFLIMMQLHEMMWYLSYSLLFNKEDSRAITSLISETNTLTSMDIDSLLNFDIDKYRDKINKYIRKTSENTRRKFNKSKKANAHKNCIGKDLRKQDLRGADLRGACLIAANMSNMDLSGADFISADMRDVNLCGADLSKSLYLTQIQINGTKGNCSTKLPPMIEMPDSWKK